MNLPKALPNYLKILEDKQKPRFQINKALLPQKIKTAHQILKNCQLCERKCHTNRLKGDLGFCQAPLDWKIFGAHSHYGEELFFIPSATLFAAGCTLRCFFCQNAPESITPKLGVTWSEKEVVQWAQEKAKECKNLNLVGGDPTPYLWNILKFLKQFQAPLPIIWNSNFYMSHSTMEILRGIIDVYLSDFKYGNNQCAERLSKVKNYFEIISRNHLLAFQDSELVIRHLILPNHVACCSKPILKWIQKNLGDKVIVNIMDQYRPCWKAFEYPDISRSITKKEFNEVVNYAKKLKLNFIA